LIHIWEFRRRKPWLLAAGNHFDESVATGSMQLQFLTYRELNSQVERLTHSGLVFGMTGDSQRADRAGNESDRYDATAAFQEILGSKKALG
jgi:hypothetical protein